MKSFTQRQLCKQSVCTKAVQNLSWMMKSSKENWLLEFFNIFGYQATTLSFERFKHIYKERYLWSSYFTGI